jgi:hypothetical protein
MTWPVGEISYGSHFWLQRELGLYLDFGADFNTWNHEQSGMAGSCIDSGMKRFYFPPPLANDQERHRWSFLNPVRTLETIAADYDYNLPDDFSGALEGFTLNSNVRVTLVKESELRAIKAKENASTGVPKFAAIRPKPIEGSSSQGWEVLLYPTPDQAYTLSYSYQVNPPALSETNPIPFGGTGHSETMLEACLAVAEERILKQPQGPHRAAFMERLAGSVELDRSTRGAPSQSWEITEPEYGTYEYFSRETGGYLGYGYNPDSWSYDQERRVNSLVQSGLRQFYFPPILEKAPYEWSFLKPVAVLSLLDGDYDYDLPEDFGTIVDALTYTVNGKQLRIEVVSEGTLRAQRSKASLPGAPMYCAVRPKATNYSAAQAWEMLFYPTPEKAYTVEYRYNVSPPDASIASSFPLGTRAHAETICASCLAMAELVRDGARAAMHERFVERLRASVALDMRSSGHQMVMQGA